MNTSYITIWESEDEILNIKLPMYETCSKQDQVSHRFQMAVVLSKKGEKEP